jgi:hypothetical protein
MKREENQLDNMFRDAAQLYGVDPPASVWDRVSGGLDAQGRRIKLIWYRRLSVAASILLAFFIGYYFPDKQGISPQISENILPFSRVLPKAPTPVSTHESNLSTSSQESYNQNNTRQFQSEGSSVLTSDVLAFRVAGMQSVTTLGTGMLPSAYVQVVPDLLELAVGPAYQMPQWPMKPGEEPAAAKVHWAMGAEASPMYAYRELAGSTHENSFLEQSMAVDLNSEEKPIMGYTAGLSASALIGKRWSLQSGLLYARQGQFTSNFRVSNKYPTSARAYTSAGMVIFDQKGNELLDSKTIYFDNQSLEGNDLIQQFDYLEVPLLARFKIFDGRLDISALAGMSGGVLVGNRVFMEDQEGEMSLVGYTYGARKATFNTQVGVALDLPLGKKLSFSLSPGMRYSLTPVNTLSTIENRPYSFMLNSSLLFGF